MSDDENFMTDRRGIKRAHESPQKVSSLFEGEALDVGDECSVESDDYPEDFRHGTGPIGSKLFTFFGCRSALGLPLG